ncbi:MAG: N-acetyltransferase, partial [Dechloromonas sp.]|nr:N-acetyltransferase [Dechloromonas sp.]
MADYPTELVRTRYLFDGSEVLIRPIRPADAPMEQDFVQHLSADSRYRRFMSTMLELPPGKLKYLTEIDYVRHLALVAIIRR